MSITYEHFHPGEVAVQEEWGTDTAAYERQSQQMMRPEINPQEHVFIDGLTFSMAGTIDADGRPWASPLLSSGAELFRVSGATTVDVSPHLAAGDPLMENIAATGQLGVLFFSPETRRRAKSIGHATAAENGGLHYEMTRLFGLCPKYIYRRSHLPATDVSSNAPETRRVLNDEDRRQLQLSDTIFFASFSPHGADVTHRGGTPGFIDVVDPSHLEIPDYFGNGMFNTLGNLRLDDRMAITDVDFTSGRTLHLTGRAAARPTGKAFPDAERTVSFAIEEVRISWAQVGEWADIEPSRYSPAV